MKHHLYFMALMASAMTVPAMAKTDSLPVGRCVNMGNSLETPTEGAWGGKKIDAADFTRIAKAGFNTIRLPVRWSTRAGTDAPHTIDPIFMKRVKQVVADARAYLTGEDTALNNINAQFASKFNSAAGDVATKTAVAVGGLTLDFSPLICAFVHSSPP